MDKPFLLYRNLFRSGFVTATSTGAGYDANHVGDLRTYTQWLAAAAGTNYLTTELYASNQSADTIAIVGHNLGTEPATVTVEGYDGSTWATVATLPTIPATNGIVVVKFAAVSKRQYRLKIVTATTIPQIGVLMIGSRLDFPEYMDNSFTPYEEAIIADSYESKTGNLLGTSIKYHPWTTTAKFSDMPKAWVYGDYKQFWDTHGKYLKPFIWVPAMDEFPELLFLARFDKGQKFGGAFSNGIDTIARFDLKMEGVVYGI